MDLAAEFCALGRNPDGSAKLRKGRSEKEDRALLTTVQQKISELDALLAQRRADLGAANSKNNTLRNAISEKKSEKARLEASSPGLVKVGQLRSELISLRSETAASLGQKRVLRPLLLALGVAPEESIP